MREARRIDIPGSYYRVLEIPQDASAYEIRRAYRRLARRHHPDINGESGAADRFSEISEAYQVLHDPAKRARYDHQNAHRGAADPTAVNRKPDTASRSPEPWHRSLGDFIADGHVSPGLGWRMAPVSGTDLEATLELSPAEAALAATTPVTLTDSRGNAIEIPAGIRHGQRIRIRGAGRREPVAGCRGDLFLTVEVRCNTRGPPYWR